MKRLYLLLTLTCLSMVIFAQTSQVKQNILELSNQELENIGVYIVDKHIVFDYNIQGLDEYNLAITGYDYQPFGVEKYNIKRFETDYYPYYITKTDSISNFFWCSDQENELKRDPLFIRKMQSKYLVPVKIKQSDENGKWGEDLIFWYTPTQSFCKALPKRYHIERNYTSDKEIQSDVALLLNDDDLKNIGFMINDKSICMNTFSPGKKSKFEGSWIVSWYNNEKDCGSSVTSGGKSDKDFKKEFMFPGDLFNSDYYIVQVTFVDGGNNLETKYKGRVIPFYISNKNRGLHSKKDVIIYLKYSKDLVEKLPDYCKWWNMPDRYTVILK